jgi:hypothetical protein
MGYRLQNVNNYSKTVATTANYRRCHPQDLC